MSGILSIIYIAATELDMTPMRWLVLLVVIFIDFALWNILIAMIREER